MENKKIFIVGSPRSGTSILGKALRNSLGLESPYSEFHLFPLYANLIEGMNKFNNHPTSKEARTIEGMYLNDLPVSEIRKEIKNTIRRLYRNASDNGSFVDKTPGIRMITEVPNILKVFPGSKIIFAKRRGLENISSRILKFPNVGFEKHCKQWAQSMLEWKKVISSLSKKELKNVIEIDQFEIANNPTEVASIFAQFLGLKENQKKVLLNTITRRTPEKTSSSYNALSTSSIDWSEEQKQIFLDISGEVMKDSGYSLDSTYYL